MFTRRTAGGSDFCGGCVILLGPDAEAFRCHLTISLESVQCPGSLEQEWAVDSSFDKATNCGV